MKLRYKIALITSVFYLLALSISVVLYSNESYKILKKEESIKLGVISDDISKYIEVILLGKLDIAKTLASAGRVEKFLVKDNEKYKNLSTSEIDKRIHKLNNRWMNTQNGDDEFIQRYTKNPLALYLKKQKKVLPGLYGEIFITNKYGALIASTGKLTTLEHAQKYWWKESYDDGYGKVFFDDRGYDDSMEGYALGIVVPIKKDGVIIGILKCNIKVKKLLANSVDRYEKRYSKKVKIARTKGMVVYENGFAPLSTRVAPSLVPKLKTRKSGLSEIKVFQKMKLVSYAPIRLSLNDKNIVFGGKIKSIDHLRGNDGEIWNVLVGEDMEKIFAKSQKNVYMIIYIGIFFMVVFVFFSFFVGRWISNPIKKLSIVANKVGQGERDIKIEPESDDEVGDLAIAFRDMLKNLKKTTTSRDELKAEVEKRIKMQEELEKKDKIILAQSRNAAMGEMISMIAHQWRQPISVIAMAVNNIIVDIKLGSLDEKEVELCGKEILSETEYLSQTIEDFRNFFKPDKEKEQVSFKKIYDELYGIIGKSFEDHNIKIVLKGELNFSIITYKRELLQVFINIFNNAKDALIQSDVKEKSLSICVNVDEDVLHVSICDNAGGIKEELLDKIFEPYFSTKEEKNGTGLGLYMSKTIVEKHLLGKIWAQNRELGACFMIELPIDDRCELDG
jgi:signal transduction histidine kinase